MQPAVRTLVKHELSKWTSFIKTSSSSVDQKIDQVHFSLKFFCIYKPMPISFKCKEKYNKVVLKKEILESFKEVNKCRNAKFH